MAKKKQASQNPADAEQQTQIAQAASAVISPVVTESGLFLEAVKFVGSGSDRALRVIVDLPDTETGSLDLDRLGDVSRAISTALDAQDVVPGAYNLEVSTPGATRPLTELRHFKRAIGRLVRIELTNGDAVTGRLTKVTENELVLQLDNDQTTEIPVADVRKGKVELEMSRVETAIFDDDVDGVDDAIDDDIDDGIDDVIDESEQD